MPVATCSCCGQVVPTRRQRIVEHAYRAISRALGDADALCPGSNHATWEESSEGLERLLDRTREKLAAREADVALLSEQTELTVTQQSSRRARLVQVSKTDPRWPDFFDLHAARIRSDVSALSGLVRTLEQRLATRQKVA